jgi:hypothetical protein
MWLAKNTRALAAAGFLFPRTARPVNLFGTDVAGHHNLPWAFLDDERFDPRDGSIDELAAEIAREELPIVIVSSEDFGLSVERPAGLAALRDALEGAGYRTSVLAYLRPQRGYAHGIYTELGRQGLAIGFETFLADVVAHGEFRVGNYVVAFDYRRLLGPLVACFGRERTIVRAYRPGAPDDALPRDFLATIASGLPLNYDRLGPIARENHGSTFGDVLASQFANHAQGRRGFTTPEDLAAEAFGADAAHVLAQPFAPLGADDAAAFSALFADSNAEIAADFDLTWGVDPPALDRPEQRTLLARAVATWTRESGS